MYGTSMCENREIPRSPVRLITGRDAQGTPGGTPEMHERGKSDGPVVPANLPNKAAGAVAEVGEERGSAKGNTASKTPPGLPDAVPGQGRPVRWSVCVRLHDETRMRGSRRCCTTSPWPGSGRPTGRSAHRPPRGWTG